jgi:hypothetical protein
VQAEFGGDVIHRKVEVRLPLAVLDTSKPHQAYQSRNSYSNRLLSLGSSGFSEGTEWMAGEIAPGAQGLPFGK